VKTGLLQGQSRINSRRGPQSLILRRVVRV
jgi:hypothetical protein